MSDYKITGSPDEIWLNYGDIDRDDTHQNCARDGEVTWCEEAVFYSDIKYVRADLVESLRQKLADMTKDRDRLLDVMCEIAGSKSLTATPTQFYQHLQRIASDATITNPEALTATEPKEQWK